MNQSGWNTRENKRRGRGDFRITPEKCEEAQKELYARKTGLGEGIKNSGGRRAGWAPGYQVPVRDIAAKTWGKGPEPPNGRRQSYSDKKKMKRGAGREDVSKQMVRNEAQRMRGSTAVWAGRRGKKKGETSVFRGSGKDRERRAIEPKPKGATV